MEPNVLNQSCSSIGPTIEPREFHADLSCRRAPPIRNDL